MSLPRDHMRNSVVLFALLVILTFYVVSNFNEYVHLVYSMFLLIFSGYFMSCYMYNSTKISEKILVSLASATSLIVLFALFFYVIYFCFNIKNLIFGVYIYCELFILLCVSFSIICMSFDIDATFYSISYFDSAICLIILSLNFLGLFGLRYYHTNILIYLYLITISIIPIIIYIIRDKIKSFPLIIFVISLTLIYHTVFSAIYLQGSDILDEYFFAKLAYNFSWKYWLPYNYNSVVGDVIFAPFVAGMFNVPLSYVFKIIIPTLFSFVPVGLFNLYRKQMSDIDAFLSAYFFMAYFAYYTQPLISNAKQMMAELFLVLVLILLISHNNKIHYRFGVVLFTSMLILSHYATSAVFIVLLIMLIIIYRIINLDFLLQLREHTDIRYNYIYLCIVLFLGWYIYVSNSSVYYSILLIFKQFFNSLISKNFNAVRGGGIYWATKQLPFSWEILKILNFVAIIFIIIGLFYVIYFKLFNKLYTSLSLVALLFLLFVNILPHIVCKGSIDIVRIYQILLVLLSPYCIVGCNVFSRFSKRFKILNVNSFIIIFLVIYFLFNCGVVSETIREFGGHDYCFSPSLSQARITSGHCSIKEAIAYYGMNHPVVDVYCARWLGKHRNVMWKVFSDSCGVYILPAYGNINFNSIIFVSPVKHYVTRYHYYLYLRKLNKVYNIFQVTYFIQKRYNLKENYLKIHIKNNMRKIYTNDGTCIYYN